MKKQRIFWLIMAILISLSLIIFPLFLAGTKAF